MLSSCPFLKSPSSKMKKSPHALVHILSPGGASSTHVLPTVYPQLKNRQMTSSTNRPIKRPIFSGVLVIARPQNCTHFSAYTLHTQRDLDDYVHESTNYRKKIFSSTSACCKVRPRAQILIIPPASFADNPFTYVRT
jgi:hypothetical protein